MSEGGSRRRTMWMVFIPLPQRTKQDSKNNWKQEREQQEIEAQKEGKNIKGEVLGKCLATMCREMLEEGECKQKPGYAVTK